MESGDAASHKGCLFFRTLVDNPDHKDGQEELTCFNIRNRLDFQDLSHIDRQVVI